MTDHRSRQAVETAELYADGRATEAELRSAWEAACYADEPDDLIRFAASGTAAGPGRMGFATVRSIAEECPVFLERQSGRLERRREEEKALSDLVREVFANPFCPTLLAPKWLTSEVKNLAQTISDEGTFEMLPILRDCLLDAGCDSDEILSHCVSGTGHVRGCWVIDRLLGKE
jgi:hypothetical protein